MPSKCQQLTKLIRRAQKSARSIPDNLRPELITPGFLAKKRLGSLSKEAERVFDRDRLLLRKELAEKHGFAYVGPVYLDQVCFGYSRMPEYGDVGASLIDVRENKIIAGPFDRVCQFDDKGYAFVVLDTALGMCEVIGIFGQTVRQISLNGLSSEIYDLSKIDERRSFPIMLRPHDETQPGQIILPQGSGLKLARTNLSENLFFRVNYLGNTELMDDKYYKIRELSHKYELLTEMHDGIAFGLQKSRQDGRNTLYVIKADGSEKVFDNFATELPRHGEALWALNYGTYSHDRGIFIDANGQIVLSIVPNYRHVEPFHEGYAVVNNSTDVYGGAYFLIDKSGNKVNKKPFSFMAKSVSEGFIICSDESHSKYRFMDTVGNFLTDRDGKIFETLDAHNFSEGLAAVQLDDEKYYFIDRHGIRRKHGPYEDVIQGYVNGLARVKKYGVYCYINRYGRVIFEDIRRIR